MNTIPVGQHVISLQAEWLARRNHSGTHHFTLSGTVTFPSAMIAAD